MIQLYRFAGLSKVQEGTEGRNEPGTSQILIHILPRKLWGSPNPKHRHRTRSLPIRLSHQWIAQRLPLRCAPQPPTRRLLILLDKVYIR